jgi:hypothetical protein
MSSIDISRLSNEVLSLKKEVGNLVKATVLLKSRCDVLEKDKNKEKVNNSVAPLFIYDGPDGYKKYLTTKFRNQLHEKFSDKLKIQTMRYYLSI